MAEKRTVSTQNDQETTIGVYMLRVLPINNKCLCSSLDETARIRDLCLY